MYCLQSSDFDYNESECYFRLHAASCYLGLVLDRGEFLEPCCNTVVTNEVAQVRCVCVSETNEANV